MELKLNGELRTAEVDPRMLLVEALRDAFGAHGPKIGCLTGDCGACTVRVDGTIVKSCLKLAVSADGAEVQTLEGLAGRGRAERAAAGVLGRPRVPVRVLPVGHAVRRR